MCDSFEIIYCIEEASLHVYFNPLIPGGNKYVRPCYHQALKG